MFHWATATIEEMARHIAKSPRQLTMAAIRYYTRKGDVETTARIKFARNLAKKYRLLERAEQIKRELEGE